MVIQQKLNNSITMLDSEEQERSASKDNPSQSHDYALEVNQNTQRKLDALYENSEFFAFHPDFNILHSDDIEIGEKLGAGGFCEVHQVTVLKNTSLAIKYLKREVLENKELHERGAADLAIEACFLAKLDHRNIVKLYGISEPGEVTAFIVMDLLYDNLDDRIKQWRQGKGFSQHAQKHGGFPFFQKKEDPNVKRLSELKVRLKEALAIAEALEYLHSKKIIHRDIKPDNVAFDADGSAKLIDFGLAKELKDSEKMVNGKYRLTGNTGVWRYMAPEIAKEWAYDMSVDTYSFGILLWEICSMERPFSAYTHQEHTKMVVNGEDRLEIETWWPIELQWLLKKCWSFFPSGRPTFEDIRETLEEVIEDSHADSQDQHVHRVGFASLGGIGGTWRKSQNNGESRFPDPRQVQSTRSHR